MFQWPRFRFSILGLLLAMTLAAVSVSHWLTSLELHHRRGEIEDLKEQVRLRNDRLGILTVDDPSQVHVIHTDIRVEEIDDRRLGPRAFWWNVHLPQSPQYEVCWAVGDVDRIAQDLSSTESKRALLNNHGETLQAKLAVEFVREGDLWQMQVTFDDTMHSWPLAEEESAWIDDTRMNPHLVAGDHRHAGSITESFPADKPVVLLKQWKLAPKRMGVVVWLQPQP